MNTKLTINVSKELLESFRKIVGQRNVGKKVEELMMQEIRYEKRKKVIQIVNKIALEADKNRKTRKSLAEIIRENKSERN